SKLGRYDPKAKRFKEYDTVNRNAGPTAIAIGQDGRIWYNESYTNRMVAFDPKTRRSTTLEIPTEGAIVQHMVVDRKDGTLWLALSNTQRIGRIDVTPAAKAGTDGSKRSEDAPGPR
ncbi:MAG: virginiamycin B lyase family protein, partial [Gammaproteobacteria bacterium]